MTNPRCLTSLHGAGNFEKYVETIEKLLEFNAMQIVCGHLNKSGTRADKLQAMEFVQNITNDAAMCTPLPYEHTDPRQMCARSAPMH
jgi:hypothetical protein